MKGWDLDNSKKSVRSQEPDENQTQKSWPFVTGSAGLSWVTRGQVIRDTSTSVQKSCENQVLMDYMGF